MVLRFAFAFLALAGVSLAQDPGPRVTFDDLLHSLSDLDALARPPAPGEACVQFSSYDRRSDAGPDDSEAWYANGDYAQFIRTFERDGHTEHVMVDTEGPGAVVRIWSANPSGQLFFYFDGEAEPRWTVDFGQLLRGELDGLGEPMCGTRARGGNCHLPIPFQSRLVVTCDTERFYYQVNIRRFPTGTVTDSFDPTWLESRREALAAAATALGAGGGPIRLPEGGDRRRGQVFAEAGGAASASRLWSEELRGPGVLRGLRLRTTPGAKIDLETRSAILRTLRVCVDCDGERTVDVPFSDFFASAPHFLPWHGLALGAREDGTGYCNFPMPCAESMEIALIADAPLPCDVQLDWEIGFEPMAVPDDALRFRASWHQDKDRRTRPFGGHLVLDASGPGRLVGTSLVVRNPIKAWWGEGDEKIFVDDEEFPSTFGTGTEDYFGYAWCCPDRFDHPLHAQPQCDGPANFGYTSNVRLHVADQIPFQERLHFDLEVWHWEETIVDYATTAYWYGSKGATSGLPAMPDVDSRLPIHMEPPPVHVVEGALECESLKVVGRTGGEVQRQDMSRRRDGEWSRDAQLWWIDGSRGDRLAIGLPIVQAGRYRVDLAFTKAPDYGIVRVRIGTVELGEAIDLYSARVEPTGAIEMGVVDLPAGDARLEFEIVGRNEAAKPRHMVGIDYVLLTPVDSDR